MNNLRLDFTNQKDVATTGYNYQSSDILKRPKKFETITHFIWQLLSKRQIKWEMVSNFVAFLEKWTLQEKWFGLI